MDRTTVGDMSRYSRPRRKGPVTALYADVDKDIKDLLDSWASAADLKLWEVVELLVREAEGNVAADGLPAALSTPQPALVRQEGGSAAA